MDSHTLSGDRDIQRVRDLAQSLSTQAEIVDLEEHLLLSAVRATLRIWEHEGRVIGFAYVDDYSNLWFEMLPGLDPAGGLGTEIVAWGAACVSRRNAASGTKNTLDHSCNAANSRRIQLLAEAGFILQPIRTLRYLRRLDAPLVPHPLPAGFAIRCVAGRGEVERLVSLHRACFGTDNMTVEQRLAMMDAPGYAPELDLVAVAPDGALAAFCVCGFAAPDRRTGYTDPIGTHPGYRRMGLGKALVSAGLEGLKRRGAAGAELGTGSENVAMQRLAASLGFVCVSERLWFSKAVP